MTYGGGPEGGVVRLPDRNTAPGRSRKAWYVWHRNWGLPTSIVRIPSELTLVTKHDDGYEALKLVMDDYELVENEYDLDDMEDANDEEYPDSDYGLRHDEDDDNNSEREDESATERDEADAEVEDEAANMEAFLNNVRREEIQTLTEQLQTLHGLSSSQSSASEMMMMMMMMINLAEERIVELRTQLQNSS